VLPDHGGETLIASSCGSSLGLYLAMAIPFEVLALSLFASGIWPSGVPITGAVALALLVPVVRRRSVVEISPKGIAFPGVVHEIPWENVERIGSRALLSWLELRHPEQLGLSLRTRAYVSFFDPHWPTRPAGIAVHAYVAQGRAAEWFDRREPGRDLDRPVPAG
jgi:uncharacterized protein (TIGR03382 family)